MSPAPLVSVIVVQAAGAQQVERCLAHLRAQTHAAHEIAVAEAGVLPVVQGEVIALLAADAYPDRRWLAAAVGELQADASVGAVASLAFHDHYPLVLRSAGGGLSWRGDRIEWCADTPYEFAVLPRDVLYPAGGAAVLSRALFDALLPLDDALGPRFAAVELGLRVWAARRRVVLCRDAWIDRALPDAADVAAAQRDERDRIRTALAYFPAAHLARWLAREARPGGTATRRGAWAWNLRHLGSAARIRRRFAGTGRYCWPLVSPSWGHPAPATTRARLLPPDPTRAGATLRLDGESDGPLGFGWYGPQRDGTRIFRRTAAVASAVVALPAPVTRCRIVWRGPRGLETVTLCARPWGTRTPAWQVDLAPPPTAWEQRRLPCPLAAGTYELLLQCTPPQYASDGCAHGVEIATLELDATPVASPQGGSAA